LVVPTFCVTFSVVRCDICNSVQIDSVGFFFPKAKLVGLRSPAGIMYTCVIFNVQNYMTVAVHYDLYYDIYFTVQVKRLTFFYLHLQLESVCKSKISQALLQSTVSDSFSFCMVCEKSRYDIQQTRNSTLISKILLTSKQKT
jgi:hypothetical protein